MRVASAAAPRNRSRLIIRVLWRAGLLCMRPAPSAGRERRSPERSGTLAVDIPHNRQPIRISIDNALVDTASCPETPRIGVNERQHHLLQSSDMISILSLRLAQRYVASNRRF